MIQELEQSQWTQDQFATFYNNSLLFVLFISESQYLRGWEATTWEADGCDDLLPRLSRKNRSEDALPETIEIAIGRFNPMRQMTEEK
ncbi:hypothetical protein NPIL_607851 [Nephila pilipes]|uniref:Uncharacterized protein n=1 Tax=Nephila pilipes TaxID=299642 RepID=A0A8X6TCY6_NEPPI|nr:hypothetical protein NPIL_607851 [Nephila pilipes]